ncbi:MAG: hypothetical protein AB7H90_07365 [Alphaproteobacteria bacterium]
MGITMRKTLAVALVLGLAAGGAVAQVPPAQEGPQNRAINTSDSVNRMAAGPVKGANSFTEGEARSRIEDKGFSNVGALMKDDDGIWRGQAMMNGQQVNVALDYQGNVFHGAAAGGMSGQTMPTQPRSTMPSGATPGTGGR